MRPRALSGPVAVLCALLISTPLAGQIAAEVRGGVGVGSHSGTAAGLDVVPKLSYEALAVLGIKPGMSAWVGFIRTGFGCEEGFCLDRNPTVVGRHGAVGLELKRGKSWLRLGALFGVTEVGDEGEASDPGPGVQAAFGLNIGSGQVRFLPGVSYRRFTAGTDAVPDHATALTADLGVRVRLGG